MSYVKISLDGGVKSFLDWSQAKASATRHVEKGEKILWSIDLGLFRDLVHPFSHQSQFLSLSLSLEHFKTDIWPLFQEHSLGLLIYQGPADYQKHFPWDETQHTNFKEWLKEAFKHAEALSEEVNIPLNDFADSTPLRLQGTSEGRRLLSLFCRDACVEYLLLLAANIPDEIPLFVELDTTGIDDLVLAAQLTSAEKYEHLQMLDSPTDVYSIPIGICLPPSSFVACQATHGLVDVFNFLANNHIRYRVIPEDNLITEWDGLDSLIVCSNFLGPQGFRKLQGFCAAGGQVVLVGKELGLPEEITFKEWQHVQIFKAQGAEK